MGGHDDPSTEQSLRTQAGQAQSWLFFDIYRRFASLGAMQMRLPATIVLYHRDADGFASAYAAWCWFGDVQVRYQSVRYGEPVPEVEAGTRVYVLDFSYPRETLLGWVAQWCDAVVLNHHKTAEAELGGLHATTHHGMLFIHFDQRHAGCELIWNYFQELAMSRPSGWPPPVRGPLPWLLRAVADCDLWHFKYPHTRAIMARLEQESWDFRRWKELCESSEQRQRDFIREGELIVTCHVRIAKRQARKWQWLTLRGGLRQPAVNAVTLTNETADALIEQVTKDSLKLGVDAFAAIGGPAVATFMRDRAAGV